MKFHVTNIYEEYGLSKPEHAVGKLSCWIQTPNKNNYPTRTMPAVLVLPGGGYAATSTREAEPIAMEFYARGYSAFVLDYSCAPAKFPQALREAVLAMDYIRKHADEWDIDAQKVAAIGFSAGGHLCGTLGTLYDCPEVSDLVTGDQARPDAIAMCYPVAVSWGNTHDGSFVNLLGDDQALRDRLSIDRLVRKDMPPVFLWHTRTDATVPVRNSLVLAVALDEAEIPFAMHVYGKGRHGLSLPDARTHPSNELPEVSADMKYWIDECTGFFAERGLVIAD